ncbi:hypothetical protein [Zymomonas mobilis]|uniref:5-bromo-4-chloroindolyl phosphate hydrolysis protein n=1 Tax=Zymomonas mobilis subsp. mobilis (strain ATCC 10988 / DSM 424 / LMG 404 / NCIMB 8938 / NRRL B-806 / ZM1) TaxID=555217 RepID=A0A0H3G0N7_ZYMMA|nr:hypothetical protein [Zymomonas mobilis]AEH63533.1 conserved hypothetical protein [Zymomonas mobilis subsp. mobilis ATCC 10988]TQL26852.1 hypothetical protein FBY55_0132 [Zymomonas mobilis]TQL30498.1 hypothetical protein FBY54_1369 [Zymomonas mobilis]
MASNQQILLEAQAVLARLRDGQEASRAFAKKSLLGRRLKRLCVTDAAIILAAFIIGFIHPLGISGIILTFAALVLGSILAPLTLPLPRPVKIENLQKQSLKQLPSQAASWLSAQKQALPPPARPLAESILDKLSHLSSVTEKLPEDDPTATQMRKLVSEEMPELVKGYVEIPVNLRTQKRAGLDSPDSQLATGLDVINQALGRIEEELAHHDLDKLATQQRFLELKYKTES